MPPNATVKRTFLLIRTLKRNPNGKIANRVAATKVSDFLSALHHNKFAKAEHYGKQIQVLAIQERHRSK